MQGSTGTYELINETQDYGVIVELTTDSGADAIQACGAEWILEGPGGDGTLPDFTNSGFSNPHTTSNDGTYSWGPIGADVEYVPSMSHLPPLPHPPPLPNSLGLCVWAWLRCASS